MLLGILNRALLTIYSRTKALGVSIEAEGTNLVVVSILGYDNIVG